MDQINIFEFVEHKYTPPLYFDKAIRVFESFAGIGCQAMAFEKEQFDYRVVVINGNSLKVRKLTPRECWRLMGISDENFDKASKVVSNSQLYKQAGNGIVVDVFSAILKNLIRKEK